MDRMIDDSIVERLLAGEQVPGISPQVASFFARLRALPEEEPLPEDDIDLAIVLLSGHQRRDVPAASARHKRRMSATALAALALTGSLAIGVGPVAAAGAVADLVTDAIDEIVDDALGASRVNPPAPVQDNARVQGHDDGGAIEADRSTYAPSDLSASESGPPASVPAGAPAEAGERRGMATRPGAPEPSAAVGPNELPPPGEGAASLAGGNPGSTPSPPSTGELAEPATEGGDSGLPPGLDGDPPPGLDGDPPPGLDGGDPPPGLDGGVPPGLGGDLPPGRQGNPPQGVGGAPSGPAVSPERAIDRGDHGVGTGVERNG